MPHLTKSVYAQIAEVQWDTIVIGSGAGGLTAAGILAKGAHERVLVLERHTVLGGCTHEFERGLEFDTGLHYVGGQVWNSKSVARRVFDFITDKRLEWARLDEAYDVAVIDGKRFPIRSGGEQFRSDLEAWFPDSHQAIAHYFADVDKTAAKYQTFIVNQVATGWVPRQWIRLDPAFGDETVDQALDRLGCINITLRDVLTYLHGDYGAMPKECSWVQHCITVTHYLEGAAYPVGGPQNIARDVAPVVEARGGRCLTMAAVVSLLVEQGQARGVVLKNHGPVRARKVLSAVGAYHTFCELIPEEVSLANPELWRAKKALENCDPPCSVSHAMAFVALRGSRAELDLPAANIWVNSRDPGEFPSVFISFPSCKDPDWAARHPNTSVCEVVVEANFDAFAACVWGDVWTPTHMLGAWQLGQRPVEDPRPRIRAGQEADRGQAAGRAVQALPAARGQGAVLRSEHAALQRAQLAFPQGVQLRAHVHARALPRHRGLAEVRHRPARTVPGRAGRRVVRHRGRHDGRRHRGQRVQRLGRDCRPASAVAVLAARLYVVAYARHVWHNWAHWMQAREVERW
jgi:all-trans-retinol 13,14-reductase